MKNITQADLARLPYKQYKPLRTVDEAKSYANDRKYKDIVTQAEFCFDALWDIRKRARRNFDFYRGKQWGDMVEVNGVRMTEEEYITSQGKPALKQNLIRPPLRNILGQYRSNPFKSVVNSANKDDQTAAEMMTIALESANRMNQGKARDARMLEYFLLTGVAIYETSFSMDYVRKRAIPKYRAVSMERFFCDTNVEDVCGEDINIIGEITDVPLIDLIGAYAKTPEQELALRQIYASIREEYNDRGTAFDEKEYKNKSFLIQSSSNLCRVIKVCRKEARWRIVAHDYADASYEWYELKDKKKLDDENRARVAMSETHNVQLPLIDYHKEYVPVWKYYHLTPTGYCLWEGETPYDHNSHPYVFKLYPMLNGSVWSMVEDLIDQQKMINRQIILQDFINSAAAKGVLLFPEDMKPDDMSWEEIADEWTRYNGIIRIKPKPGVELPKQVVSETRNNGVIDMIRMQMELMQDIGGVQDANMGRNFPAGTPASMVIQLAASGSQNTLDYLESFAEFIQIRDFKVIQLIKQFYKDKRYQDLGGNISPEAKIYDPDLIRNIDFDNTISKGNDSPTYRMAIDDMLYNMTLQGLIDLKTFLEHSSFPFSDRLLASLKSKEEQLQQMQGQAPQQQTQQMQ